MKFKAIIFDLDGTIINTNEIWRQATKDLIQLYGAEYSNELENFLNTALKGVATENACKIIKKVCNISESVEKLVKTKKNRACQLYEENLTFIEGFKEFHKNILFKNLKSAIATNSDIETLNIVKEKLHLQSFFKNHIYSKADVNYRYKPNPAIFLYTADKLKINPKECIVIEDSACGIEAAKKAGMYCIGINTDKNKENIKKADIIIDLYEEINLNTLL